jgi:hypothetical protein
MRAIFLRSRTFPTQVEHTRTPCAPATGIQGRCRAYSLVRLAQAALRCDPATSPFGPRPRPIPTLGCRSRRKHNPTPARRPDNEPSTGFPRCTSTMSSPSSSRRSAPSASGCPPGRRCTRSGTGSRRHHCAACAPRSSATRGRTRTAGGGSQTPPAGSKDPPPPAPRPSQRFSFQPMGGAPLQGSGVGMDHSPGALPRAGV